jgi:hypothetical protein
MGTVVAAKFAIPRDVSSEPLTVTTRGGESTRVISVTIVRIVRFVLKRWVLNAFAGVDQLVGEIAP